MAWKDYIDTVEKLYIAYYQRPADPAGLVFWAKMLDATGGDLTQVIDAFGNSPEAKSLYGDVTADNIEDVIKKIYKAAFNRDPDPEGLNFYKQGFLEGKFTPASIALDIVNGARGVDAVTLENKLESALNFTKAIDPDLDGKNFVATYKGDADAAKAREWLAGVTSDVSTVKTANDAILYIKENIADQGDSIVSQEAASGNVFTMTHDIETIQGTSSDDIIKGIADNGGNDETYQAGDKIDGGAGNDELQVTMLNDARPVEVKNVEKIVFTDASNLGADINAVSFEGNPLIVVKNVAGQETDLLNLTIATKVEFQGSGDLALKYIDDAGTDDNVTIVLNGVGINQNALSKLLVEEQDARVLGDANVESVTLETQGTNYVQLGDSTTDDDTIAGIGDGISKVVVTGDGTNYIALDDLKVTTSSKKITVDASKATGSNTFVDTSGEDPQITYKLGSGDDTVKVIGNEVNNDVIDGGDGTDTLLIDLDLAGAPVAYASKSDSSLVNVEKVEVYNGDQTTATATIDLSKQTENFEIVGGTGNDTITAGSGADTIDGGKGADIIKGGKGADKITTGAGADTVILDSPFNAADKITDFTSGSDKLKIDLTTEGAVGALGNGKFGGDNAVDGAYTAKQKLQVLKFTQSNTGGKFFTAKNTKGAITKTVVTKLSKPLTAASGNALTAKEWLKGKSITFGTKTIKLVVGGATKNISKLAGAKAVTATGVLFFYDTDDHVLKMYGLKIKNASADTVIDKVSVLTVKTIAHFTEGHDPAAGDIVIF